MDILTLPDQPYRLLIIIMMMSMMVVMIHVEVNIDFCDDCDHDHDCVYGDDDPEDDDPRSINSPMPAYLKMFSRRNHIPSPGHCVHGKIFTS